MNRYSKHFCFSKFSRKELSIGITIASTPTIVVFFGQFLSAENLHYYWMILAPLFWAGSHLPMFIAALLRLLPLPSCSRERMRLLILLGVTASYGTASIFAAILSGPGWTEVMAFVRYMIKYELVTVFLSFAIHCYQKLGYIPSSRKFNNPIGVIDCVFCLLLFSLYLSGYSTRYSGSDESSLVFIAIDPLIIVTECCLYALSFASPWAGRSVGFTMFVAILVLIEAAGVFIFMYNVGDSINQISEPIVYAFSASFLVSFHWISAFLIVSFVSRRVSIMTSVEHANLVGAVQERTMSKPDLDK